MSRVALGRVRPLTLGLREFGLFFHEGAHLVRAGGINDTKPVVACAFTCTCGVQLIPM